MKREKNKKDNKNDKALSAPSINVMDCLIIFYDRYVFL